MYNNIRISSWYCPKCQRRVGADELSGRTHARSLGGCGEKVTWEHFKVKIDEEIEDDLYAKKTTE